MSAAPRPVTPTTILARELAEIVEALEVTPGVAPDVLARLGRAQDLAAGLDPYVGACTTAESAALAELARRTRAEDWAGAAAPGSSPLEQEMLSGHVEGQLLTFLVRMVRARRVLEIGMFTGYSALAMAEGLPPDGEVVACEVDPRAAGFARECLNGSTAGARVTIEMGDAMDTLRRLDGRFDLVFIDADKPGYEGYLGFLLDSDLLHPETLIAVDNTLMQGQPFAGEPTENGEAIARFNRAVAADERIEQVLVPLRDGITLIRLVQVV